MIVVSENLTTGEISFILRVTIQILSYGGLFLIGLIIFGSVPHIAPVETHDVLNRVVGQSTVTTTALTWIARRVFRRSRDPISSSALAFALALFICYGLFVSLSDVGLIGIHSCSVTGSSFKDFPASIKSDSDALAVVSANMADGYDPHDVKSYRCDAAHMISSNGSDGTPTNISLCDDWLISTYGDPSNFIDLNSTDSDVLMLKNLATLNGTPNANTYLIGASRQTMLTPTIAKGLAVIPHETGVVMIVGVPQLAKEQKVDIPKTLAFEVEMGCLPLGMYGERSMDPVVIGGQENAPDFFVPDEIYLPERMGQYVGPDTFLDPLMKAADGIRSVMRENFFNSSTTLNVMELGTGSWENSVSVWSPPAVNTSIFERMEPFLDECSQTGYCRLYQISGSFNRNKSAFQGYSEMICETAVQVSMVFATIAIDGDGDLDYNFTRLPSDLNNIQAQYTFQLAPTDYPDPNVTGSEEGSGFINRFTLSDNPIGALQHTIPQSTESDGFTPQSLDWGLGSSGEVFSTIGYAMVVPPTGPEYFNIVNSTFFSANFSASQLTGWAGGLGASYILHSLGYNGWAARGSEGFTVVSTGGQNATCYDSRYGAAFLPLFLAALAITCWAIVISFTSGIQAARRLQNLYGGLSPTIDLPFPGKLPEYTALTWENDPLTEPRLKPAVEKMPMAGAESELLVPSDDTDLGLRSDSAVDP